MAKNKIEPHIILTIDTHNTHNIPLAITDVYGNILHLDNVNKLGFSPYKIRKLLIEKIKNYITEFNIDTILMETNKLFIDKIDRYPDPFVLQNVLLGFSIKTSIEDNFYNIKYILEIPDYDWRNKILNSKVTYSIDLYKQHILLRDLNEETLNVIEENNYYRVICLSESTKFDSLMLYKYQTNKGD